VVAWLLVATGLGSVVSSIAPPAGAATIDGTYTPQGPGPVTAGQVENVDNGNLVTGALHTVVPHPTDANIIWAGAVNGGLWRTNNATAAQPTWTPLTDQMPGLSIGALELDPTVGTNTVLVAGLGRSSSFNYMGGPRTGLLRTTNGGGTWTQIGVADLTGENIWGVAPRGNTIVAASTGGTNSPSAAGQGGIFRSTDGGTSFTRLSGNGTSGLPNVGVYDLASDPSNSARLYAGTQSGIFRSTDTGATWTNVTNQVTSLNGTPRNVELAVSNDGNAVYAGVINASNQLGGLWRSGDQGANWTQLDTPTTNEGGLTVGIQPRPKPGGQGDQHFSMRVDPANNNLVYLGGDRQPANPGPDGILNNNDDTFPNSIGADTFSGRLFRCNAAGAAGSQCAPITHNGTANDSAPHADSRDMAFDANGDLVEVDDGGIYRQTNPSDATGRWQSMIGTGLQIQEGHSCAYDSVGDLTTCGTQDIGAPEQNPGSTTWGELTRGDGGYVAVDDSNPAASIRYSSSNSLSGFTRRTCTAANACASATPTFNVTGTGQNIYQFDATLPTYTPVHMNKVDPTRFIVSSSRLYESTDRLDNLTNIGNLPAGLTRAVAYGGRQGGADSPAVLWYGAGGQLFLRTGGTGFGTAVAGWGANGTTNDIVLNPEDWADAYVTEGARVFHTTDAGLTFTNISGNLTTENPGIQVWSLEVVPIDGSSELAVLAGTDRGIFLTQTQNLGTWSELGNNLPNTHAFHLEYDVTDDLLMVSTMGRGVWTLGEASEALPVADLAVSKFDSPDPVKAGEELFYTVVVSNEGDSDAQDVVVVDELPDEVIFLEDSAEGEGGECAYDAIQHDLTCTFDEVPANDSISFEIKTLVESDAVVDEDDGTIAIQNVVRTSSSTVDSDTSNNSDTETTFVQEKADLKVSKDCKPDDELPAGQTGTCTIYVDNLGPSSARDVILRDTHISDGAFTFGAITASQGTCDPPADGVIVCNLGDLSAASTSQTGRATVTVEVSATEDVDINDIADARSPTPDPNTANNEARDHISVMAVADLALDKTGPASGTAGTTIQYDIAIRNDGPSTAQGVVVEDDLSPEVEIASVTGSKGGSPVGCNVGTPGNPDLPSRCSFGTMAPGATGTMTVIVRIKPDARGPINDDARVYSSTFDDELSNNLDSVQTNATGSADLSITKTDSPDPVIAGQLLTYTIVVTNNGPSTAEDVVVTDDLPAQTTYQSGVDGNGQTICTEVQTDRVVCQLGDMGPGTSETIYITVRVDPSTPPGTTLQNSATVSSSTSDPNPGNNTDGESTSVNTSADVWIDKQAIPLSGNPSPRIRYTLVVHNNAGCETDGQSTPTPTCGSGGPSDALGIVVTDRLPLDSKKLVVQFVSPQCTYTKATHTVQCTSSRVPAGAQVTFIIEVQVSGSVGTILNTATLTTTTPDPDTSNNENAASLVMKGGTGKK
jgi:uncharacterized repeat protein (TIGR01451 family)